MSSSTLSRTNSKNAKYKDYVSFLQSYKTGANDQSSDSGGNFSLTNSSNNSSSSVFSDNSDNQPRMKNKLQESLRNIKNQNGEVNRNLNKPNTNKIKTEMVIQINNPPAKKQTHVFEVKKNNPNNPYEEPLLTVSHAAKFFENNEQKSNGNAHQVVSKKSSIGEMTKRFENVTISHINDEQRTKSPIQKKNSINEVSKIFENENKHHDHINTSKKFNNFNTTPKAFTPISQNGPKLTNNLVKPPITSPKPEIDAPHFFRTNLTVLHNKASSSNSTVSSLSSLSTSPSPPHSLSPTPPMMYSPPLRVASPPPLIVTSATPEPSMPNIPPPPPFEDKNIRVLRTNGNANPSIPTFTKVPINSASIPAPPPLPAGNPYQKSSLVTLSTKVPVQPNETNDLIDGTNGTINKNDPRVKRAVYGALRNMYGAYHDQANDYIATLPRNRVKKNNKLDGIIETIALQGGLDKMTGRANPSANKED